MDPNEKPEALRTRRDPTLVQFSLDQSRRALKRNLVEIQSEEGRNHCNSIFAYFRAINILIWMI